MKRITQTKEIQTGDNSGVVFSGAEKASYSENYALSSFEDNDLITRKAAEDLIASLVPSSSSVQPYNPLVPTDEDDYVTHVINDIEYLFRSNEDANVSEPILPNGTAQTWSLVGISELMLPRLWSVTPTPIHAIRWKEISSVTYQFASTIAWNISEPTLETEGAWIQTDIYGFISIWDNGFEYNTGNLVTGDANTNVYRSKVDSNIGNNPNGGLNPTYWELVGAYIGFYSPGTFNLGDVVIVADESNRIYISNKDDNDSPLTDLGSTWLLLGTKAGGEPPTILTQADLIEESYGGVWYLEMDVPDGLTVGCIDYKEGTVTNRLSIDNAVTDTANTPNTRISGFPNNNTQTITIKLI